MLPVGAHRSRIRWVVVAATAIAVLAPAAVRAAASQGALANPGLPPVVAVPEVGGTVSATQATSRYVFPVFGTNAKFSSDYGSPRAGTGWHHGNDIFAPIGTPALAIADGVLSKVGVNTLGGNRLWLRDGLGNTYYYAHLSGYASHVADGVRVRAGEIIGFVGNTGQAITTPPHLHFEIHPGDGPSVDPYPYLLAWQRGTDVALAFTAAVAARGQAPAVGAVLVGQEPPVEQRDDFGDGLAEAVP